MNLFPHPCSAQNKKMDSLKVELQKAKQDTARLRISIALCNQCETKENLIYANPTIALADKLISQAKTEKEKNILLKQKAEILSCYSIYYRDKEGDASTKALEYFQEQFLIYKQLKDKEGIKSSLINIADSYSNQGNLYKRLETLKTGLAMSENLNYKNGMSRFIAQIGFLYAEQGDTSQAIAYLEKGLQVEKEMGDTTRITRGLVIMGNFQLEIGRHSKALEYYFKALPRYEIQKDTNALIDLYFRISAVYYFKGDTIKALKNIQNSIALAEDSKNEEGKENSFRFLGKRYREQKQITKAIEYHIKALNLCEKNNFAVAKGWNFAELAEDYLLQQNCTKAQYYIRQCFTTLKESDYYWNSRDAEQLAYKIDSACGNFKDAFLHYQKYIFLKNKENKTEVQKEAAKEKYQNEYDKQKAIDKTISDTEIEKQKIVRNSFIGGFALMLLLAGVSYRNFRRKKKDNIIITNQKLLVEEKNREITDSIEYALRIQTAILPPQRIVKQYLENSFILYKPKDIVAGDFYWMETKEFDNLIMSKFDNAKKEGNQHHQIIKSPNHQIILFAACDCTGHGVPGAMVSVVCHNALNRAVREFGLTKPSEILDKTAEIVIENFAKSEEDIKDGMDISMVSLKYNAQSKKTELEYAGANNPLWIVKRIDNGELTIDNKDSAKNYPLSIVNYQLSETKADKQPIGMNEDNHPFTNHTFELNSGDTIYLFTDGFADQFGGDTGEKKLTRKKFKELILSIQHLSMTEQGLALDKFITDYRKEVEQIDDILVMGVRV